MPTPPSILIVDDEPEIVTIYTTKLQREGFTVLEAHDEKETLAQVRTASPDLILLDIKMPGVDGLTIAKELHEQGLTKHSKIVFHTAFNDPGSFDIDNIVNQRSFGVLGIIRKGVSLEHFMRDIHTYLEQAKGGV